MHEEGKNKVRDTQTDTVTYNLSNQIGVATYEKKITNYKKKTTNLKISKL